MGDRYRDHFRQRIESRWPGGWERLEEIEAAPAQAARQVLREILETGCLAQNSANILLAREAIRRLPPGWLLEQLPGAAEECLFREPWWEEWEFLRLAEMLWEPFPEAFAWWVAYARRLNHPEIEEDIQSLTTGGIDMTYQEVLENARRKGADKCRTCRECNGVACRGEVPGMGGKGTGEAFVRNVAKLREIALNLDVIYDNRAGQDSSVSFWGHTYAAPVFAAPISGMGNNYSAGLTEDDWARAVVEGSAAAGVLAFTGDGVNPDLLGMPLKWMKEGGLPGVPTIKPWGMDTIMEKLALAKEANPPAIAMDVDSAGLPFLTAQGGDAGPKPVEALAKIAKAAGLPFLVKGVMTPEGARKAAEAGAWGIVVSNHGGRVLDHTPATCEVLPRICAVTGNRMKVFVDGGIRTGVDVFKMLALGADGVLIGRPVITAAYGGGAEGVRLYLEKVIGELRDTMKMTGCGTLADITRERLWQGASGGF